MIDPLRIKWLVDYGNVDIICYSAIGKHPAIRAINRLGLAGHIEEITTDPWTTTVDRHELDKTITIECFRQVAKVLRRDVSYK